MDFAAVCCETMSAEKQTSNSDVGPGPVIYGAAGSLL